MEPHIPWNDDLLFWRAVCYASQNDRRADQAADDLIALRAQRPPPFKTGLEAER
jgi:hypothetical protein